MPGQIFLLLCGYRVRPLYHRVRNHPEACYRTSVMYFANPNSRSDFRPWIANPTNAGVDIIERAVRNPTRSPAAAACCSALVKSHTTVCPSIRSTINALAGVEGHVLGSNGLDPLGYAPVPPV